MSAARPRGLVVVEEGGRVALVETDPPSDVLLLLVFPAAGGGPPLRVGIDPAKAATLATELARWALERDPGALPRLAR